MAFSTLHPSLSSLFSNLEGWQHLAFASIDKTNQELLEKNKEFGTPVQLLIDSCVGNHDAINLLVSQLTNLSSTDTLFYSRSFLSNQQRQIQDLIVNQLRASSQAVIQEHDPKTLSELLELWNLIGKQIGKESRARDLQQRVEAQILDWTSNFYARLKGKRVVVVAELSPLVLAGSWILDIVRKIGAIAPEIELDDDLIVVDWNFIKNFDPHVIIFAPLGKGLKESARIFFEIDKLAEKDKLAYLETPAAKRGEVYFVEGTSNFYTLDYRILKTLGVIVSACAGFDSGYISERDSFYKLRYLELHRHLFK